MKKYLYFLALLPFLSYAEGFLGPDTTICKGQCVKLSIPSTTAPAQWSTGETTPSIIVCRTKQDTIYGEYFSATSSVKDTIIIKIKEIDYPYLLDSNHLETCLGDCIKLKGVSGGLSYSWLPITGVDNPNIADPTICIDYLNSDYTVTVVADTNEECVYHFDVHIAAAPIPGDLPFNKVTICKDSCAELLGPSGGQKYMWSPAEGINNNKSNAPKACPSITTQYIVATMTDTSIQCVYHDTVTVTVKDSCVVSGIPYWNTDEKIKISYYNNKIWIEPFLNDHLTDRIEFYDIGGRLVYEASKIESLAEGFVLPSTAGIFFVKIIYQKQVYNYKIFVPAN